MNCEFHLMGFVPCETRTPLGDFGDVESLERGAGAFQRGERGETMWNETPWPQIERILLPRIFSPSLFSFLFPLIHLERADRPVG